VRLAAAFILAACCTAPAREGHVSSLAIILDIDSADSVLLPRVRCLARLPKMRKSGAAAFLVTAIATITWNAVAAVLLGCVVAAVPWMAARFAQPACAA
jgi:hypothetical protein